MAKVKMLTIADMVDGSWYVVKTNNTKVNGALVCCKKNTDKIKVQGRIVSQEDVEWIYKVIDGQKFIYRGKPAKRLQNLWPRFPKEDSPNAPLWNALKDIEFSTEDFLFREDYEEYYVKSYFDKENFQKPYGLNVAWLDPTFVPEFKDNKYKYLFQPVELALPKTALGLSELKTISALQEHIERIKTETDSCANYITVYEDLAKHEDHFRQACHASLSSCKKGVKYILSSAFGYNKTKVTKELKWYVNYLVNVSSFCDAFLIKDVDFILDNNCYIISGDVPGNIVGLACIATRQPWEYEGGIPMFYSLCEAGVPQHLAFMAIQSMSKGGESFTRGYSGHSVLPTDVLGNTGILNYIAGNAVNSHKDSFYASSKYSGVCASYGEQRDNKFFNGLAALTANGGGWKQVKVGKEELVKLAVAYLQEWADENY